MRGAGAGKLYQFEYPLSSHGEESLSFVRYAYKC